MSARANEFCIGARRNKVNKVSEVGVKCFPGQQFRSNER